MVVLFGPIDSNGRHASRKTTFLVSSRFAHLTPFMGKRRAFPNLPAELLEYILDQPELNFRDLLRCKRVCAGPNLPPSESRPEHDR